MVIVLNQVLQKIKKIHLNQPIIQPAILLQHIREHREHLIRQMVMKTK